MRKKSGRTALEVRTGYVEKHFPTHCSGAFLCGLGERSLLLSDSLSHIVAPKLLTLGKEMPSHVVLEI